MGPGLGGDGNDGGNEVSMWHHRDALFFSLLDCHLYKIESRTIQMTMSMQCIAFAMYCIHNVFSTSFKGKFEAEVSSTVLSIKIEAKLTKTIMWK